MRYCQVSPDQTRMLSLGLWLTILAFPIVGAQVLAPGELRTSILNNCAVIFSDTSSIICQDPTLTTTCANFFVMAEICRWTQCGFSPPYPDAALLEVVQRQDIASYQLLVDQCVGSTLARCEFARLLLALAQRADTGSTAAPVSTTTAITTQAETTCPQGLGAIECVASTSCVFVLTAFTCPTATVCCAAPLTTTAMTTTTTPTTTTTTAMTTTTTAMTTTLQACPIAQGTIDCVPTALCPGFSFSGFSCPTMSDVCCLAPLTTTTPTTTTTTGPPCPAGQGSIVCVAPAMCLSAANILTTLSCPMAGDVCCTEMLTTTMTTTTTAPTTTQPPCPMGGSVVCVAPAMCLSAANILTGFACPMAGAVCCTEMLTTTTITTTMTTTTTPTTTTTAPTTTQPPCPAGQGSIDCVAPAMCLSAANILTGFACPMAGDACCTAPLTTTTAVTTTTTATTTTIVTTTLSPCEMAGLNCRATCAVANTIPAPCPMASLTCCIV